MYLFDTDTLSQIMRRNPPRRLLARLDLTPREYQFTSAINVGELLFGAYRSPNRNAFLQQVESLIFPSFEVLPFELRAADVYARVRATLEREGRPLADADLRIAAVAIVNDLTLVTGNVRHFTRIPDLRIENWIKSYS
jgi:predicted nucleic acid-binding protein|tara:strand:+ start:1071 stop:1484 length:414 start_codon:yes stop_codon:yes gene_type:complete